MIQIIISIIDIIIHIIINMQYKDFRREVQHFNSTRKHKITKSVGVYDAYKWIRKNKWLNIGRPLTEHEFYSIIRKVNLYLADEFILGYNIKLPHKMGQLELRKSNTNISIKNGKVVNNFPIDWDKTLKLWYEDEEAYKNKTLVKIQEKEVYRVYYNKQKANFKNKSFYEFKLNRDLKIRIKQSVKSNILDAFKL